MMVISMLAFEDLGSDSWQKYGELILKSENVFPEAIRTPEEDYADTVKENGSIAKVALLDSQYVGNIFGYALLPEDLESHGLHDVPQDAKVIYIFNVVVNPEYQGKGIGKQLLWEFIRTAKDRGYDYIAGHFRQNGSLQLIKKLGAKEEGVYHNWENMGEDCVACCLNIHIIQEPGTPQQKATKNDTPTTGLIQIPSQEQAIISTSPAPQLAPELASPAIEPHEPAMHF
ncbi:MAG: GNAT family N-acetyltransferase [Candidatus Aenigmatarchaeota archaeon]